MRKGEGGRRRDSFSPLALPRNSPDSAWRLVAGLQTGRQAPSCQTAGMVVEEEEDHPG